MLSGEVEMFLSSSSFLLRSSVKLCFTLSTFFMGLATSASFLKVHDPPILGLATLEPIILSFHLKKVVVVQMFLLPASAVFQSRI